MKFLELRKHMSALAVALRDVSAGDAAQYVLLLVDGLAPFNKRTVAELKSISLPRQSSDSPQEPRVADVVAVLEAFEDFIRGLAKPLAREALGIWKDFLADRQEMTIRSFLDALHDAFAPDRPKPADGQSIVDAYVDALRTAKHDDEKFPRLFAELTSDERLSKDDVVEVASRFAFKMGKSTSKKVALERIWKMHNASETFAAKSRAMKGKSAA